MSFYEATEDFVVKVVVGVVLGLLVWFYQAIFRKVQARNPVRKVTRSIIILLDERKARRNDKEQRG